MAAEPLCIRTFGEAVRINMNKKSVIKKMDCKGKTEATETVDASGIFAFYSLVLESLLYAARTDDSGDVVNVDSKMTTNLKNGKSDVHDDLVVLAQAKGAVNNVSYFFAVNLIPNIVNGRQDIVLDAVLAAIENDNALGKVTQNRFKKWRKDKTPADFLAEAFILAVCGYKNKQPDVLVEASEELMPILKKPTAQPDMELRLLTETGGICPDCGHKSLVGNKTDQGVKLYEVVRIYPNVKDAFDNRVALCLDCARNYAAASDEDIRRMASLKMKLIQYTEVREKLEAMNIEQDIKEVLQMILAKPRGELSKLSYEALCVADKVKDDAPLILKIESYVTAYFLYISKVVMFSRCKMMFPNKITPYAQSTIAKFLPVLKLLRQNDMSVSELYKSVKTTEIGDTSEFLCVIDCLYALGMIEYDEERRVLFHVEGNTV